MRISDWSSDVCSSDLDLTPADLTSAHLYDGFSWLTVLWLEALGITKPGATGDFLEGGQRIALDGVLPLNTNGGQLSEGRLHAFNHLVEAVRSEEHTSELQSLMRISYAVFCLKKKK